mmetsp:Transcript_5474/g.12973  ORF Transcript_5474/g.12973 Transcript_5474/m.12973 type:complete len:190 (+) Transcript_5474:41-610(+)
MSAGSLDLIYKNEMERHTFLQPKSPMISPLSLSLSYLSPSLLSLLLSLLPSLSPLFRSSLPGLSLFLSHPSPSSHSPSLSSLFLSVVRLWGVSVMCVCCVTCVCALVTSVRLCYWERRRQESTNRTASSVGSADRSTVISGVTSERRTSRSLRDASGMINNEQNRRIDSCSCCFVDESRAPSKRSVATA